MVYIRYYSSDSNARNVIQYQMYKNMRIEIGNIHINGTTKKESTASLNIKKLTRLNPPYQYQQYQEVCAIVINIQ